MKSQQGKSIESNSYLAPNLERALVVIELLKEFPQGLTLSQIQEYSDFPMSSLSKIVLALEERGYLVKCEQSEILILSKKILNIGLSTLLESKIIENSLPFMRQLRDEIEETVLLGTLVGEEGVLLEQVQGSHSFTIMLKLGKSFLLHASAPGKAIMAFLPEAEAKTIITNMEFTKFNERTITNIQDYEKELNKIRELGYAVDYAEEIEGVHCVAAPIFNQMGHPISVIWITAPSGRLTKESFNQIGAKVKKTALSISQQFLYNQQQT
jgi:DNA-binding IclR family transcriptional regulator